MASEIPDPPYKVQVTDENGYVSPAWAKWFRGLFDRIGRNRALTNIELEEVQTADLTTLETNVTALQTLTSTHTSQIAALDARITAIEVEPAS